MVGDGEIAGERERERERWTDGLEKKRTGRSTSEEDRRREERKKHRGLTMRCDREGGGRWHCHLTKECRDLTRISLTAVWPEGDGKYEEKKSGDTAAAFIGAKELVKQTVCPFRRFRYP